MGEWKSVMDCQCDKGRGPSVEEIGKEFKYSKTCLKWTPTGPENLSALDRCPPYRGYVRFLGNLDIHTPFR